MELKKHKKFFLFLGSDLLLIILMIYFFFFSNIHFPERKKIVYLKIGQEIIEAELVDTPEKRAQGLSGRPDLKPNQGMLFVFPQPGYYSFWMKGMLFPLDFLWLKDGIILETTKNVPPPSIAKQIITITPSQEVDSVLEVKAGFLERNNVKVGERVEMWKQ